MRIGRLLGYLLLFLAPASACSQTAVDPPASVPLRTHSYPDGIKSTLGISSTEETLDGESADADQPRFARDGFGLIRLDVHWQEVERTRGVWDFSRYDAMVDRLLDNGLEPVILLLYGNPLYYDGPCPAPDGGNFACLDKEKAPFYRYVRKTLEHFKGRVKYWEVWNEPNGWFRFWPHVEGGDPAAFAELLVNTAGVVKAVCADCRVISGGMVYLPSPISTGQVDFMAEMRRAVPGVFDTVDGIGFHAYTFYPPVDPPELDSDMQVPLDEALENVRAACRCDKPLWVTETGWSAVGGLTEERRAEYAVRGFLISLSQGAQSWLWWSSRKISRTLIVGAENEFGLLTTDGTPLPAYEALRTTMALLGEAVETTDARRLYGLRAPYEWAVRFGWKDGRSADVIWYGGRGEGRAIEALEGKPAVSLVDGSSSLFERPTGVPMMIERPPR